MFPNRFRCHGRCYGRILKMGYQQLAVETTYPAAMRRANLCLREYLLPMSRDAEVPHYEGEIRRRSSCYCQNDDDSQRHQCPNSRYRLSSN